MGKTTNIQWTATPGPDGALIPGATFNTHWGCFKVSPGCTNCYADTLATRYGLNIWGPAATTTRRLFGDKHWREPLKWDAEARVAGVRKKVFCNSMSDVFEDHPLLDPVRERLFALIRETPNLDWLVLTKRIDDVQYLLPAGYWPNVWLGTSVENQEYAEKRIPPLLALRERAPILFLSVEPQIGPVTLQPWIGSRSRVWREDPVFSRRPRKLWGDAIPEGQTASDIDWVIVGGESGARRRPFDPMWARTLHAECQGGGIAFFFKQHGGRTHAEGGCLIDGQEIKEFPAPRERALVPA